MPVGNPRCKAVVPHQQTPPAAPLPPGRRAPALSRYRVTGARPPAAINSSPMMRNTHHPADAAQDPHRGRQSALAMVPPSPRHPASRRKARMASAILLGNGFSAGGLTRLCLTCCQGLRRQQIWGDL